MPCIEPDIDKALVDSIAALKLDKLQQLTTQQLVDVLDAYHETVSKLMYFACILRKIDLAVIGEFERNYPDSQISGKILREITVPKQLSYSAKEEEALLRVAKHLEENPNANLSHKLKKILENFAWVVCGYADEPARSLDTYHKLVAQIISEQKSSSRLIEIETNHHNDKLKRIAKTAAESAYLKDHYKFSVNKAIFYSQPLYVELAKRLGVTPKYLKTLVKEEIAQLLTNRPIDEKVRQERLKCSIIFAWQDHWLLLQGNSATDFINKYLSVDTSVKELKGRTACTGLVKGKACVVHGTFEFHKNVEGCILVVANTSPDFVPILGKVKAIVAEEGGITAHVSVISRELRIPCIVGVKRVLNIINDGEELEVNATAGTIKRLI
jgi:phosphohistidine swiveling domain-containing protein